MFGKKLKRENKVLIKRVQDLEEKLCPNKFHLWKYEDPNLNENAVRMRNMFKYDCVCTRCGKRWEGMSDLLIIGAAGSNRARRFYCPE